MAFFGFGQSADIVITTNPSDDDKCIQTKSATDDTVTDRQGRGMLNEVKFDFLNHVHYLQNLT